MPRGPSGGPGGGGGGGFGPPSAAGVVPLKVPNDAVGLIIGRQGTTIRGIQERTGANVQIPQAPDQDDPASRTVSVSGPSQQQCDQACQEIRDVISTRQDGGAGAAPGGGGGGGRGGGPSHAMVIKNEFAGAVIGKQGSTIKSIQERTGCRVSIPSQMDPGSNPPARTLIVTGNDIGQAVHLITEAILNRGGPGGNPLPPGSSIEPGPPVFAPPMGYGVPPMGYAPYGAPMGYGPPMGYPPMGYGAPMGYPPMGYPGGADPQQQQQQAEAPASAAEGEAGDQSAPPPPTEEAAEDGAAAAPVAAAETPAAPAPDQTAYYEAFWQYFAVRPHRSTLSWHTYAVSQLPHPSHDHL